MFALNINVDKHHRTTTSLPDFQPVIYVDCAVQVEEAQLEPSAHERQHQLDESELFRTFAPVPASASNSRPSSTLPRRSGGASPWLLSAEEDEGEDNDEGEDEAEDLEYDVQSSSASTTHPIELAQAGFTAGHNFGELLAGSIGFYRYEQPGGVVGLRPPPLRSNVVCIMAVPSWMSSSDLLHFIGGYTRYTRQIRLLRDTSMPNRHMLVLQFASASIAERFRADYHAKRFNSLEPEVALVVHVAQVTFATPREARRGGGGAEVGMGPSSILGGSGSRSVSPEAVVRSVVAQPPQVHVRLHVTPLTLRLSRQSSRQISPSEHRDGSTPRESDVGGTSGGGGGTGAVSPQAAAVSARYQAAVDARLMELSQLPKAERRGEAQREQKRQRTESRLINDAFAEDEEHKQIVARDRAASSSTSGLHPAGGESSEDRRIAIDVCGPCAPYMDLSVGVPSGVGDGDDAADGSPPVRLQLWVRDKKKAPMRAPTPSMPPLPPPTAGMLAAVERASRGHRATLPPLPDHALLGNAVELPSCPVCLERLDPSISGVVTIVCDHTFHCECLRRWSDSSCPVCRHVSDDSQSTTSCEVCGNTDSLWICLVCGHVGCGRYTGCNSSVHHNEATNHSFAMELSTQRVWDYKGDNYVHRLIQNKVDGKLVELPDPRNAGSSGEGGVGRGMDPAAKEVQQRGLEEQYEAVVHEYSLLLTGQLEVQRLHYEERLAEVRAQLTGGGSVCTADRLRARVVPLTLILAPAWIGSRACAARARAQAAHVGGGEGHAGPGGAAAPAARPRRAREPWGCEARAECAKGYQGGRLQSSAQRAAHPKPGRAA